MRLFHFANEKKINDPEHENTNRFITWDESTVNLIMCLTDQSLNTLFKDIIKDI